MTDERIGQYVTREREAGRLTLPHLVESVIEDEPVTRCGRRLRARPGKTWFHYSPSSPIRLCERCS